MLHNSLDADSVVPNVSLWSVSLGYQPPWIIINIYYFYHQEKENKTVNI